MVSVIKRMRKLQALLSVRVGTGAAVLSPQVTKIHLDFAIRSSNGHGGPKLFWRKYLKRLKYHNPGVPMTVNRTTNQDGPATMTIHYTSEAAASDPPPVSSTTTSQTSAVPPTASQSGPRTEKTEVVNIRMKRESEILSELYRLTAAKLVKPSVEDTRLQQEIEEQNLRSRRDQILMQEVTAKRKREEALLAMARGEVESAREIGSS